ncbi:MAG TPA: DUF222 domain-containing protein [Acidimicrobiales bacterium]|nr:DUF222 domain-containing protein [Acidimicrobiales bacterium]
MSIPLGVPKKAVADITAYLAQLEPERVTTAQASELFGLFAELTRLGSAGQMLLASRVRESDAWKNEGHRSAASWVARAMGTGLGDAIATLETAERLELLPRTTEALRNGDLSALQVREIAAAAAARPSAEVELLEAAGTCTLQGLKDRCRRVRAVAGSTAAENERYEAVRKSRFFRHWSDPDGALRGEFKLTPDAGARLLSSLDARANELFDRARKTDNRESPAAYAADALVELVTRSAVGATMKPNGSSVVHVRVDAGALRRGYVEDGEVCEIPGVGPVPVSTARSLMSEAFVKLLVTEGVDVLTVCHVGRGVPAHVRSAIEERDPTCVVPGCDVAMGLEIDHWQTPYAEGGRTTLGNLARLCHFHHAMKTYRGFGLGGGPGKWEWQPPPDFESG